MPTTDNLNDLRLTQGVDEQPVDQAPAYLVPSDAKWRAGFVRPVRTAYVHAVEGCGALKSMSQSIAETCAQQHDFYGSTYCFGYRMHRPVAGFRWDADGQVVRS